VTINEIAPCEPVFVNGRYEGCGVCPDCLEDEDQEIEHRVEMGDLTDEEAQEIHRNNYNRRTMGGLLEPAPDDYPAPESGED
jgi:hypothetical protein